MGDTKAARIWKRTWVGALLAGGAALVLGASDQVGTAWPVLAAGTALSLLCVLEMEGLGSLGGRRWLAVLAGSIALTFLALRDLILASDSSPGQGSPSAPGGRAFAADTLAPLYAWSAALALVGFGAVGLVRGFRGWRADLGWTLFLSLWLIVPLPALAKVWLLFGSGGLAALIVLSKIGDVAGYYAGSAFGRRHPFPRLSPGKTVEGCAASFLAGTLAGGSLEAAGVLPHAGWWGGCAAGAAVNVAAQAGDLLESWVKRRAGVKDSGTWLGPAGGLLDVVDSLLVSVPAALASWPFLLAAGPPPV